ncbi:2-succinyl-5-enolpyruvyl-6-hydroxy-3-cyclohexene-1-carboxylic-acid synthase [Nocardioides sp. R-C-SC26]|uniref:2-succinyl-5-enolpyruvyl-6-hydroxy-3- cyclohexene-1-carboxylic-acid synthase n=1 Tax=Nocardioides sp. R-C-SC26 TaxID=2870414 RepID=UPI001E3984CF|nr:2-succinyl-5-enolpyruvyl-6-hydroxy-3-cyclohexene-1-carboxylic-acid synthase [Nocardioides sp. R-C-SC26]
MTATALARAVVQRLIDVGVREIVIAPGSRNAPLTFAAFDAATAGLLRLHTRLDERSAGFLALGLTREHSRAAVICTSGTAVANLHPAALEAAHAGVSVVFVTADRPARLRGTSANQTTEQPAIFGPLVPWHDLADLDDVAHLGGPTISTAEGPTHLNVQLDDPLMPEGTSPWTPSAPPHSRRPERLVTATPLPLGPRTVVVAGDDAGPQARRIAETGGWPLLAEPSSGSRTGPALRTYRLLLGTDLGRQIERVVVAGRPTLSRPVARLLAREDVEVIALPGPGAAARRPFPVAASVEDVVVPSLDAANAPWLESWRTADRDLARRIDAVLSAEPDLTPYEVAGAVSRALPPEGLLVLGPSSPIRDLDLMAAPYPVGQRRKVIANRGLSGIDGVVSTAIGAALGRRDSSRAIALMGDVTFLHDANGLLLGPGQPEPDLTIVVVNDDGGSIFAMLEQGASEHADRFEALFAAPHGVDLAGLCAASRTPHWRVESLAELEQALATPNGGIDVVEVRVRRDNRRDLDERLRALALGG